MVCNKITKIAITRSRNTIQKYGRNAKDLGI